MYFVCAWLLTAAVYVMLPASVPPRVATGLAVATVGVGLFFLDVEQ